jgi:hypothetical protein
MSSSLMDYFVNQVQQRLMDYFLDEVQERLVVDPFLFSVMPPGH